MKHRRASSSNSPGNRYKSRPIHILIELLLAAGIASAADPDFRSVNWGISKQKVIEAEGKPLYQTDTGLTYSVEVAGMKAVLIYEFVGNQLARGGYALAETYVEPGQYILAANRWLTPIKAKYGEPKRIENWVNDLYKGDDGKTGLAVSAGHLQIAHFWDTPRTTIGQIVSGNNFKTSVIVTFSSKLFASLLKLQDAKKDQKDF